MRTQKNESCGELTNKEFLKLYLKEKFLKIILEGSATPTKAIDDLFNQNPSR